MALNPFRRIVRKRNRLHQFHPNDNSNIPTNIFQSKKLQLQAMKKERFHRKIARRSIERDTIISYDNSELLKREKARRRTRERVPKKADK